MATPRRDSFSLITPAEHDKALDRALRLALLRVILKFQIHRMQHLYHSPGSPTLTISLSSAVSVFDRKYYESYFSVRYGHVSRKEGRIVSSRIGYFLSNTLSAVSLLSRQNFVPLPGNGRRRLILNPYCYLARHAVELGMEQEILDWLLGNSWVEELMSPRWRWVECEDLHPAGLCPRRRQ
ncbi:hypothetical protein BCR34DRAFT_614614 [Clohesyomyces aquaticus]|uniref:Uncharacterized protein n=1 Tax=Clohesyomyces aquaticus TaxID=1231657 RepID=A0A1Y1ZMC5_9PLEO|nr:hypothetical protein BCR34DRAFT_614614 [Clohesyomyces aquaticus]